jgi:hypothetical protein
MRQEARRLFKAHKLLEEPSRIEDKLLECEQRIELCLHYRNPYVGCLEDAYRTQWLIPLIRCSYPRLINAVNITGEQFRTGVTVASRGILPGYLSSYYESPNDAAHPSSPSNPPIPGEDTSDSSNF